MTRLRSVKGTCTSRIRKSKTYIVPEMGRPKRLLSTRGGMSMPPVLAPSLMTRPRPQPMHRPPKSAHRKGSVVSTVSPSRPWTQPSNEGYAMVLASVLRANVLPSATRPTANMTRLNAPTKGARGMPTACCTARPIPVVPPVTRPPGTTNTATPRAYTKLPKMIQAKRETTCLQVLVTRCSFSPTSSSFIKKIHACEIFPNRRGSRRGPNTDGAYSFVSTAKYSMPIPHLA